MNNNWFKINRELFENDIWHLEPFTRGQAWVDLIGNANHAKSSYFIRGNEIIVDRGQLGWSELTMAKRWKWSRNKVRRFLFWLEKRQQVKQQKNALTSITTIVNYDKWQAGETTDDTTERQQKDNRKTTDDTHTRMYKNVKNVKKDNNNTYIAKNKNELSEVVQYYNKVFSKSVGSYKSFEKNFDYWIQIHSINKIKQAIYNASKDKFWEDKLNLTILFRKKNPRGEDVDYIEDLSSRSKTKSYNKPTQYKQVDHSEVNDYLIFRNDYLNKKYGRDTWALLRAPLGSKKKVVTQEELNQINQIYEKNKTDNGK